MLKKLTVKNFALIENAELDLQNGFTVITGETGSGKSILLGALRLILGDRADLSVVREASKKTIVEGVFDVEKDRFIGFFQQNDLDFYEETILRREINANGKSRAFINDSPVQLSVLKELTSQLIFIHSQHHTLSLKSKKFQLELLDAWAKTTLLKNKVENTYKHWKKLASQILEVENKIAEAKKESDYNQFQLEELQRLNLSTADFSAIEQAVNRMEQLEDIKAHFGQIDSLVNNEGGVSEQLLSLQKKAPEDQKLNELLQRIESVRLELIDIAAEADDELQSTDLSFDDIESKVELLNQYNAALNKHRCSSQEELIALESSLLSKISSDSELEIQLEELKKEHEAVYKNLVELANKLSEQRKSASPSLSKEVRTILDNLKLPETHFEFVFDEKELSEDGIDNCVILFSPNKGIPPHAIEKSASGGELSRLMLAIQSILAKNMDLPSLIFDEIDTGVSGEVADRIGVLLRQMGETMQLFAITHLPQVAGKGEFHISVRKNSEKDKTKTSFVFLNGEERVDEIAKIMSGTEINQAARENALKLMN